VPADADARPFARRHTERPAELDAATRQKLVAFDLDGRFGPCLHQTRLHRWEKAHRYGLAPPEDVRRVLLEHRGDAAVQRAALDRPCHAIP
jgi:hypothetical protein